MTQALPKVHIVATGGTMGYLGRDRLDMVGYGEYGRPILIHDLLARIPEASTVARVSAEQMYVEDFKALAMSPTEWVPLAQRCNELFRQDPELAGIVVTHGTNVLEETAYFLNLTVTDERPVVLTAAQRPSTAMSSDVDINLLDAIRVAAAPQSRGKGTLAVLNNEVHAAREVTKSNTYRLETFHPRELGFLGYADSDGQVVYYRAPLRRHTFQSEFDVSRIRQLPWVDIVYVYGGADGRVVEALVDKQVEGLVMAGMGAGGMPPAMREAAAAAAAKGVAVVLSSRAGNGRVILGDGARRAGFVVADNLTPQKARVLLMLGLTVTREQGRLQEMFNTY